MPPGPPFAPAVIWMPFDSAVPAAEIQSNCSSPEPESTRPFAPTLEGRLPLIACRIAWPFAYALTSASPGRSAIASLNRWSSESFAPFCALFSRSSFACESESAVQSPTFSV